MTVTHHDEHLRDRAAMLLMRGMVALQPKSEFGPAARPDFDTLMEKTPAADGVTYEAATIGGVAGWWCRPADAAAGAAVLYVHGAPTWSGRPLPIATSPDRSRHGRTRRRSFRTMR